MSGARQELVHERKGVQLGHLERCASVHLGGDGHSPSSAIARSACARALAGEPDVTSAHATACSAHVRSRAWLHALVIAKNSR